MKIKKARGAEAIPIMSIQFQLNTDDSIQLNKCSFHWVTPGVGVVGEEVVMPDDDCIQALDEIYKNQQIS